MAGQIGNDPYGHAVLKTLGNENIDTSLIQTSKKSTGVAFIFIGQNGANQIINAAGANYDAQANQIPDDYLIATNTVVCQMETEPMEVFKLIDRAKENGARTILNFAPAITPANDAELNSLRNAIKKLDYLIVNEIEAEQIAKILSIPYKNDHAALAYNLAHFSENLTCIITLGEKGAVVATQDNLFQEAALDVVVKDTTGAGDAFCGGFAAALDQGLSLAEAVKWGSVTGSLACREIGCQPPLPYKSEIQKKIMRNNP
jgi:ribokinase